MKRLGNESPHIVGLSTYEEDLEAGLGTMWGGKVRFELPMMFAIGFVSLFVIGGLSGVLHSEPPL